MYEPRTGMPVPNAPLPPTDFHVLLVLGDGELYGYAIMKALDAETGGAIRPEIGSLYRTLGRLVSLGWVAQVDGGEDADPVHPGKPRKYYRLTDEGRLVLRDEVARLQEALRLARRRNLLPEGGTR